jgi:peptide/nickel transport system substrate-binding protein
MKKIIFFLVIPFSFIIFLYVCNNSDSESTSTTTEANSTLSGTSAQSTSDAVTSSTNAVNTSVPSVDSSSTSAPKNSVTTESASSASNSSVVRDSAPAASADSLATSTKKKVLNFGVFSVIATLEPTISTDSWWIVRVGVGETLVRFSKTMTAEPWLAESWSVGDDKLTWTFKIRDGIKFSNGNPLTAEAVKKSLERVYTLNEQRFKSEFFSYETIEADGSNLIIKTVEPTPVLPGMLADPFFLILDTSADDGNVTTNGPICTGPYKYIPSKGDIITSVKNDLYWDGTPLLDEVNFIPITDPNTRAMALQSGDVDLAANMSTTDVPMFLKNPDFSVEEIESLRLVMAFMNTKGTLEDEYLRKAIKSALDLKTYSEKILSGRFIPAKGPIPPSLGYGFDALVDPYSYDIEKAKSYLVEGGYSDSDNDGYVDKDGVTPEIDYVYYSSRAELPLLVEATQHALAQIGVKINLKQEEGGNFSKLRADKEFDILIMNILTANVGDPQSFLVSQFETNAYNNSNDYSNPDLDSIFRVLKVEFDIEKREDLIAKAQQALLDKPAHIFYAYPNTNIIHNKRITGVEMLPADYYWVTKNIDIKE